MYDAARRNDTLWLCDRQTAAIPANRYLLLFDSKAARTKILRFAQNDERAAGRKSRNAAYKTHRPKGDTFPFEPSEPFEPFEPFL
nr:hypothetical protein [uncultured Dialister sp.]